MFYTVTMDTQNHATPRTSPYNVVFGIESSSEPVSELIVGEDNENSNSNDAVLTDNEISTPDNHLDSKGVENLTAKNLEIAYEEGIYYLYFIELLDTNALAATDTVADEDDLISGSYDSSSIPGNCIQKDIHVDVYALAVACHEDIWQKTKKRLLDAAEKMTTKYNASKKN